MGTFEGANTQTATVECRKPGSTKKKKLGKARKKTNKKQKQSKTTKKKGPTNV